MALLGVTTVLARRRWILGLFVVGMTLGFLSALSDMKPERSFLRPRDRHLPDFRSVTFYLAGVAAYLYRERFRHDRRWAILALAGILGSVLIPCGLRVALPTLGTYLILYLAFTTDWNWHQAGKYGDFSYGVYLYAWPIQQFVMMKLGGTVNPLVLFAFLRADHPGRGLELVSRRALVPPLKRARRRPPGHPPSGPRRAGRRPSLNPPAWFEARVAPLRPRTAAVGLVNARQGASCRWPPREFNSGRTLNGTRTLQPVCPARSRQRADGRIGGSAAPLG